MNIKLKNGRRARSADVASLQRALGFSLPDAYVTFVLENDGALPEPNIFRVSDSNDSGVTGFVPVKEVLKLRAYLDGIPRGAFPVAWAECGDHVLIDVGEGGAVYYRDHEIEGPLERIAADFNSFLSALKPFDIKSVHLDPSQVQHVWIDPDFLAKLRRPPPK